VFFSSWSEKKAVFLLFRTKEERRGGGRGAKNVFNREALGEGKKKRGECSLLSQGEKRKGRVSASTLVREKQGKKGHPLERGKKGPLDEREGGSSLSFLRPEKGRRGKGPPRVSLFLSSLEERGGEKKGDSSPAIPLLRRWRRKKGMSRSRRGEGRRRHNSSLKGREKKKKKIGSNYNKLERALGLIRREDRLHGGTYSFSTREEGGRVSFL